MAVRGGRGRSVAPEAAAVGAVIAFRIRLPTRRGSGPPRSCFVRYRPGSRWAGRAAAHRRRRAPGRAGARLRRRGARRERASAGRMRFWSSSRSLPCWASRCSAGGGYRPSRAARHRRRGGECPGWRGWPRSPPLDFDFEPPAPPSNARNAPAAKSPSNWAASTATSWPKPGSTSKASSPNAPANGSPPASSTASPIPSPPASRPKETTKLRKADHTLGHMTGALGPSIVARYRSDDIRRGQGDGVAGLDAVFHHGILSEMRKGGLMAALRKVVRSCLGSGRRCLQHQVLQQSKKSWIIFLIDVIIVPKPGSTHPIPTAELAQPLGT